MKIEKTYPSVKKISSENTENEQGLTTQVEQ